MQNGRFSLRVLNPTAVLEIDPVRSVPRIKDLNHKRIGLYWNHKARGNVALSRVQERLSEKFEDVSFVWLETNVAVKAPEGWVENVKNAGVDAVVAASGD